MTAEFRTKSQITLPKTIVSSFGLEPGDKLEVIEKDGMICMIPVAVYPKSYVEDLQNEVSRLKKEIKSGKKEVFSDINALFDDLEKN